jgi:hypothetical protein
MPFGILILVILGMELLAVGIAAMRMLSTSAKYFLSRTTNAENKFQKL